MVRKWLQIPVIVLLFAVSVTALYAEENLNEKNSNKYIFSYDQEIPTLIRYGEKVSGGTSKTGCIGYNLWDDGRSRGSIDIGYNITFYELQEPLSTGRLLSIIGFGYIPFIELFTIPGFISDKEVKSVDVGLISPLAGYSYSRQVNNWLRLGFSIYGGPVYCAKIKPWSSREEFEKDDTREMWYDYDEWLSAYDAIGNISGKWGVRINPKIKLYLLNFSDNTVHVGLGFGYVQYVFADNHFNSYDIGLDFAMAF